MTDHRTKLARGTPLTRQRQLHGGRQGHVHAGHGHSAPLGSGPFHDPLLDWADDPADQVPAGGAGTPGYFRPTGTIRSALPEGWDPYRKPPAILGQLDDREVQHSVAAMHISPLGLDFLTDREHLDGTSNHLHWPPVGDSGVTLGSGYDMKEREETQIVSDLVHIEIDAAIAAKAAKGAKLSRHTTPTAQEFVKDNRNLLDISKGQERQLLVLIIPHYEQIVRNNFHGKLTQYQFDALVSFCYNPQRRVNSVAELSDFIQTVRRLQLLGEAGVHVLQEAALGALVADIQSRDSGGNQGLKNRRKAEVNLFLYGRYDGKSPEDDEAAATAKKKHKLGKGKLGQKNPVPSSHIVRP